jgi:hypothetical protein
MRDILVTSPYNEDPDSITMNPGELQISVDSFYMGVRPNMLENFEEMKTAYEKVTSGGNYFGLHIDEVNK